MNAGFDSAREDIAAIAARLVVEEGLEYGAAKKRAVRQLGLGGRARLPDNDELEDAVREYLLTFCADTQPGELAALRDLAALWMERLADFRPHLCGAVWQGTATRLSDIYLQLFCDDPKSAEIALIDKGVRYQVSEVTGFTGDPVDALSISCPCPPLGEAVGLHLMIHDFDQLRGALKPDGRGQAPRGDLQALRVRMSQAEGRLGEGGNA